MEERKQYTLKDYALAYARKGLAVFPITPGQKFPPLIKEWQELATTDEGQVRKWWKQWPNANIGIATGEISGSVFVVDVDNKNGREGSEFIRDWEDGYGEFPENTWRAITPSGGYHLYFRDSQTQDVRNMADAGTEGSGVDIRGTGGYVVAPPSKIDGRCYEWELGPMDDYAVAAANDSVYALLAARELERSAEHGPGFQVPEVIPDGIRNATLFRLASSLQAKGLSDEAILAAVLEENRLRCSPPDDEKAVIRSVRSALRYKKGDYVESVQAEEEAAVTLQNALEGEHTSVRDFLSPTVLQALYGLPDALQRQQMTTAIRERAKELKLSARDVNAMLKAGEESVRAAQAQTEENGIDLPDNPLPGLRLFHWHVDWRGVFRQGFDGTEWACRHPILITKRLSDVDTGLEQLEIAFKRDGQWRRVVVPSGTALTSRNVTGLADFGILATSENSKLLVSYFTDLLAQNEKAIPIQKSIGRLGWITDECQSFAPYADGYTFNGQTMYQKLYAAVTVKGDFALWKEKIWQYKRDHDYVRAALAASFASPLLSYLGGKLGFVTHLQGDSGNGKTVAAHASASVWGNPLDLVKSFNATSVGMERLAAFLKSVPLYLDEMQTVRGDKYMSLDKLIYELSNGEGRTRGGKSGGLAEQPDTWNLVTITTGEDYLVKDDSGGGAKNRVLELSFKTPAFADFQEAVHVVHGNYGSAGKEFIKGLIENPNGRRNANLIYDEMFAALSKDATNSTKQLQILTMLCLADCLSNVLVWNLELSNAMEDAAAFGMRLRPLLKDESEAGIAETAIEFVTSLVGQYHRNFIMPRKSFELDYDYRLQSQQEGNELWGKYDIEKQELTVIAQVLRNKMREASIDPKRAFDSMVERGFMKEFGITRNGRAAKIRTKPVQLVSGSALVRCYVFDTADCPFDPGAWEEDEPEN